MAIPRSVNGMVNWLRVLPRLGVSPETSVLPAVTGCPACGADRLYIFQDTLSGGEWHHCRACGSVGDMISLSARHWKLDLAAAVSELTDRPGPEEVCGHLRYAEFQEELLRVARAARECPPERLKPEQQKLFLTATTGERWRERLGRFAGVASRKEVDGAINGYRANLNSGGPRHYIGRGWGELFVVPFQDLPGRVRGFWSVGRENDVVFASVLDRQSETGLGFLDVALGPEDAEFGRTLFVLNDTLTAVRLHDKNFQQSAVPLPLLACHAHGKMWARLDNGVLAGRGLVFWGRQTTRELLRQAKAGNGRVAAADGVGESMDRYFNRFSPRPWLRLVEAAAVHWTLALERFLGGLSDQEAEATLTFMGLTEEERRRFFEAVSPGTRERLYAIYGQAMTRTVEVDGFRVTENNGVWTAVNHRNHPVQVTDAPFRIERVVQFPDRDTAEYHICATFRGHEVRFVSPVREFDKNPFGVVRDEVRRAGVGMTSYSIAWSPRGTAVATKFREPEFVIGADRCGWSEPHAAWVFAGFTVGADGTVAGQRVQTRAAEVTPTLHLRPPGALHPDDVTLLGRRDHAGQTLWATAAAVVANLVAPVANRETCGIALVGAGAQFLGAAVARHLGCARTVAFNYSNYRAVRTSSDVAAAREAASGWPLVIERGRRLVRSRVEAWLTGPGPRNAVVALDLVPAAVLGLQGGWHVIENAATLVSAAEYARAVPLVVPAFLKWFAGRGLSLDEADTFGDSVLDALSDWFAGIGGDPVAVSAARDRVRFDHGGRSKILADRFVELLGRLALDGDLAVGATAGRKIPFLEYVEDGNLFIPKASLNKLLAAKGAPGLEPLVVTRALAEEGVLVHEPERGSPPQPGWVVERAWWNKRYESWRRLYNRRLRLVV